jgi:ligand-binding sensor domain-containing protein
MKKYPQRLIILIGIGIGVCMVILLTYILWETPKKAINKPKKTSYTQIPKENISNVAFSGSYINSIIQDKQGFLWLASWDGLFMYDGYQITTYKAYPHNSDCFKGRKVRCLYVDSDSALWVGTMHEGLHRFNRQTGCFEQFTKNDKNPHSISDNDVAAIWEDTKKNLWVMSTYGQVNKVIKDGDSLHFEAFAYHNAENHFLSATLAEDDKVWIGSSQGLILFDMKNPAKQHGKGNFQLFELNQHEKEVTLHNVVNSIVREKVGKKEILWLGTWAGVKKITFTSQKLHPIIEHLTYQENEDTQNANRIRVVYQTQFDKEHLWLGSDKGILKLYKKNGNISFFKIDSTKNEEEDKISCFYEDASGVLWIGNVKGVKKIDQYKKNFIHLTTTSPYFLPSADVKSIIEDTHQNVWLTTNGGGLQKLTFGEDKTKIVSTQQYKIDMRNPNVNADFIFTMCQQNDMMCVGTDGYGICKFKIPETSQKFNLIKDAKHYTLSNKPKKGELSDKYIYALLNDQKHNLWVGTFQGGLNRYDAQKDKFIVYNKVKGIKDSLNAYPIVKLLEDSKGDIWVGTRGAGIYVFHPNEVDKAGEELFRAYQYDELDSTSLLDNYITDIFEDSKHNIWVGTESGLCLLNAKTQKFRSFNRFNGFPDDLVQSIQSDSEGNLWISSKKSLVKFNRSLLDVKGSEYLIFQKFDRKDGVLTKFFNNSASCKTQAGMLLFGGVSGVTTFQAQGMLHNPYAPPLAITDFVLNNQSVPIGLTASGRTILSEEINQAKKLVLKHEDKIISFEFSALHFAEPEKNQYAYKMEGFDKDWIFADAQRRLAHYTNLPAGEYTFKIKGSNNDGVWNNESKSLEIIVLPPFWQTTWAYLLYALLVLLGLYSLRRITLIRANLRHKIQMERFEREKSDEMHQLELQFFTNISHEIRTPLTLILGPLEKLTQTPDLSARVYNQLTVMFQNGQRLLRLLNQLMDFRKQGHGYMKLQVAEGNFIKFMEEIYISFRELAKDRNICYEFKPQNEVIALYYDRDMLEKIFYNLLSNAFKYTSDNNSSWKF